MIEAGRIREWSHESGLTYWTLAGKPTLSETALARALAVLLFCHQTRGHRTLLTQPEIQQYFPDLFRHGLPGGHYLERTEKEARLGNVRVDVVPARISRIVSRTTRLIDRYRDQLGFRRLIDAGRFEIAWLVPTWPKQRRLQIALAPLAGSGVRIAVHTITELLELTAPIGSITASPLSAASH